MTLRKETIYNGSNDALVLLQWDPLTYQGNTFIKSYNIMVSSSQTQLITTNVTMLNISVAYNINYTVRVTAMDCEAFDITSEIFKLGENESSNHSTPHAINTQHPTIVNCSAPSSASGVVIEPYSNTTEGAVIYYKCAMDQGYFPNDFLHNERMTSVCGINGKWNPDPAKYLCFKGI